MKGSENKMTDIAIVEGTGGLKAFGAHKRKRRSGGRKGNMAGLRKARCVRTKMGHGSTKTNARKACGVKAR